MSEKIRNYEGQEYRNRRVRVTSERQKHQLTVSAGIIGLDVAFTLAEQGYGKSILVVAEHLPGDTSIRYTSPWAGANFSLISGSDKNALRWDQLGYARLKKLFNTYGEASMIKPTSSTEYWDVKPSSDKINSIVDHVDDVSQQKPYVHAI